MRNKVSVVVSRILITCLLLLNVPIVVIADDEPEIINENNVSEENVTEKTENTTTYELSGGELMTVFYGESVRYRDSRGDLQDYNPELKMISDSQSSNGQLLSEYAFENKRGDSKHYFPESISEDAPIILEKDGASISISPQDEMLSELGLSNNSVVRKEERVETLYEEKENKYIRADYNGEKAELEYTSEDKGIKENLVLNEKPESNKFRYKLKLDGLEAVKNTDDEGITIINPDKDEIVASINAPYMTDALGEISENIILDLKKTEGENEYVVVMTVDESFLENASYPVNIDPTTTWTGNTMFYDAMVCNGSSYTNKNYYNSSQVFMKTGKGSNGTYQTYIRFNSLGSKLSGKSVSSAKLTLYAVTDTNASQKIGVHRVKSSWTARTLTWSNKPGYDSTPYSTITTKAGYFKKPYTFSMTTYAKKIASKEIGDYGIMIRNEASPGKFAYFYGTRHSSSSYRPKLAVTYCSTPVAVSGITLSRTNASTGSDVRVNWTNLAQTDLKVQYKIEKQSDDGAWTTYKDIAAAQKNMALPSGLPEGTYRVALRTINDLKAVSAWKKSGSLIIDKTLPAFDRTAIYSNGVELESENWIDDNNPEVHVYNITDNQDVNSARVEYAIVKESENAEEYMYKDAVADFHTDEGKSNACFYLSDSDKALESGIYDIYVRISDAAGNKSSPLSVSYYKDVSAPTGSIECRNSANETVSELKETITIQAEIDGTGSPLKPTDIDLFRVIDNDEEEKVLSLERNITGTKVITFNTEEYPNGKYRIKANLEDAVGKTAKIAETVTIANSLPGPAVSRTQSTSGVTIGLSYGSNSTKIIKSEYKEDGTDSWMESENIDEIIIPFEEECEKTFWFRGIDSSGTPTEEIRAEIPFDKTKPVVFITGIERGVIRGTVQDEYLKKWELFCRSSSDNNERQTGISGTDSKTDQELGVIDADELGLESGQSYEFILRAEDENGNQSEYVTSEIIGDTECFVKQIEPEFTVKRPQNIYDDESNSFIIPAGMNSFELENQSFLSNVLSEYDWYIGESKYTGSSELEIPSECKAEGESYGILVTKNSTDERKYSRSIRQNDDIITRDIETDSNGEGTITLGIDKDIVSFTISGPESESDREVKYFVKADNSSFAEVSNGVRTHVCDINANTAICSESLEIFVQGLDSNSSEELSIAIDKVEPEYYEVSSLADYLPDSSSVKDKLNGRTYFYWDNKLPSDDSSLSYNVYRSTSAERVGDTETLVAEHVKAGYYCEMNQANPGDCYYYAVSVVRTDEDGTKQEESVISSPTKGIPMDKFETTKHLGLSEKWSYTSFATPVGTGSIEESKGNLVYVQNDAVLPNENLQIELARTYNSKSTEKSAFGLGWHNSFDLQLLNVYDEDETDFSNLIFKDGTGYITRFIRKNSGEYISSDGEYLKLERETKTENISVEERTAGNFNDRRYREYEIVSEYTLTSSGGMEYRFNSGGQLVYLREANGAYVVFEYDSVNGQLRSLTSDKGYKISIDYYGENSYSDDTAPTAADTDFMLIKRITLPNGNTVNYSYGNQANLLRSDILTGVDIQTYDGKTISYNYQYDIGSNNLVSITDAENNEYAIQYTALDSVSKILCPNGEGYSFSYSKDTQGDKTITERLGPKEQSINRYTGIYDASSGQLLSKTDSYGNESTFSYIDGILTEITYPIAPRSISEDGSIIEGDETIKTEKIQTGTTIRETKSEVEADGTRTTYEYADDEARENNLPKTVITKDKNGVVIENHRYTYDENGNELTDYDVIENQTDVTVYNDYGSVIRMETRLGEGLDGEILSSSSHSYEYDSDGSLTEKSTEINSGVKTFSETQYDSMGRIILEKSSETRDGSDANVIVTENTQTQYDSFGRIVFEEKETPTSVTKTSYEYDRNGQVLKSTTEETPINSGTTSDILIVNYSYDSIGRVTEEIINDNGEESRYRTEYSYCNVNIFDPTNPKGKEYVNTSITKVTDVTDVTAPYVVTETITGNKGEVLREKKDGVYCDISYDRYGVVTATCIKGGSPNNTEGQVTLYVTDENGQVTDSIQNPENRGGIYAVGENSLVSTCTYDAQGRVVSSKNAAGHVTSYEYNSKGEITSVRLPDGSTTNYSKKVGKTSRYDRSVETETTTDANGHIKESISDTDGNLLEVRDVGDSDDDDIFTKFEYDKRGLCIKESQAKGNYKTYEYDDDSRITREEFFTSDGTKEKEVTYEYDYQGLLTSKSTFSINGTSGILDSFTRMSYDSQKRLKSEATVHGDGTEAYEPDETELDDNTIEYVYSRDGLLSKVKYGSTKSIDELSYTYDRYKRPVNVSETSGLISHTLRDIEYDEYGRISVVKNYFIDGEGYLEKTLEYDNLNRVTAINVTDSNSGEEVESYAYTYDNAGNVSSEVSESTYLSEGEGREYAQRFYTYDENGRLTKVEIKGSDNEESVDGDGVDSVIHSYKYDSVGNRTRDVLGDQVTSYSYNGLDQLTHKITKAGEEILSDIEYEYDRNGNRTSEKDIVSNIDIAMSYDSMNMMHTFTKKKDGVLTASQTNIYDSEGQRIRKIDRSEKEAAILETNESGSDTENNTSAWYTTATDYYYQGDSVLLTESSEVKDDAVDTSQSVSSCFNLLDQDGSMIGTGRYQGSSESNWYLYNRDPQGSITSIVGSDGRMAAAYDYDEYGDVTKEVGTLNNEFRYTGQVYDENTDLYYYNSRYYDQTSGCFTTQDTERGEQGNPGTLNYYTYCNGNPVNNVDPTGHSFFSWIKKTAGKIKHKVSAVKQKISKGYHAIKNAASKAHKSAKAWIRKKVKNTKDRLKEYKKKAKDNFRKLKSKVHELKNKVSTVKHKAKEILNSKEIASSTKHALGNVGKAMSVYDAGIVAHSMIGNTFEESVNDVVSFAAEETVATVIEAGLGAFATKAFGGIICSTSVMIVGPVVTPIIGFIIVSALTFAFTSSSFQKRINKVATNSVNGKYYTEANDKRLTRRMAGGVL